MSLHPNFTISSFLTAPVLPANYSVATALRPGGTSMRRCQDLPRHDVGIHGAGRKVCPSGPGPAGVQCPNPHFQ